MYQTADKILVLKKIFFCFLSVFYITVNAQDSLWNPPSFYLAKRTGFIIPHHSSFVYLIKKHVQSFDLQVLIPANGKKEWQHVYNLPELGFGYYHADLGNPDYMGNVDAGFGTINIYFIRAHRFALSYGFSAGIAILSKPFDPADNYYNYAIGSKANVFIDFRLNVKFRVYKKLLLGGGIQFTHYSNGAWKVPNLGFNIPSVGAGIVFETSQKPRPVVVPIKELRAKLVKKNEYWITYSGGIRENHPPLNRKYYVSCIAVSADRNFTCRQRIGIGLDIYYDSSIPDRLKIDENVNELPYRFRSGVRLSHDLVFNKVSFVMQTGAYFYTKDTDSDGFIYSRFGIRAKLLEHFGLSLTLKTHFFKADLIEFGAGYYF